MAVARTTPRVSDFKVFSVQGLRSNDRGDAAAAGNKVATVAITAKGRYESLLDAFTLGNGLNNIDTRTLQVGSHLCTSSSVMRGSTGCPRKTLYLYPV